MKVIDLLNEIANGEEINSFIYKGGEFKKGCDDQYYYCGMRFVFEDLSMLNEEIEIIEEPKKIEKIDIRHEKNINNNYKWLVYGEEHKYNISTPQKIIADKINEIIDYINKDDKNDLYR